MSKINDVLVSIPLKTAVGDNWIIKPGYYKVKHSASGCIVLPEGAFELR